MMARSVKIKEGYFIFVIPCEEMIKGKLLRKRNKNTNSVCMNKIITPPISISFRQYLASGCASKINFVYFLLFQYRKKLKLVL